jgi:CubicO group peptidase (beta-lactamase class C family)
VQAAAIPIAVRIRQAKEGVSVKKRWVPGFAILVGLLLLGGFAHAQTPSHPKLNSPGAPLASATSNPVVTPEEVGLSSERLERIASTIQRSIDDGRISGGISLVARHGKIVYLQAVGMADRNAGKPMRTDTIFRICSMSKPITAVAVMILYEEGRFELSDPVSDYLPEFKHMKVLDPPSPQDKTSPPGALVDAKRPITIFNLLTHTSGLTYQWNRRLGKTYLDAKVGSGLVQQQGTIGESVKRLATLPLMFQPGDSWEYSLGLDVAGRLVEVVSGMPFDKFLEERIFKPLGMKDTCFFLPPEKVARIAALYSYDDQKGLRQILDHEVPVLNGSPYSADYPYNGPRTFFSGGAGLCSTAEDYYRFCQMMLNNGELNGVRIISRKSVELMSQNHVQGKTDGIGYGLGFGTKNDPQQLTELGSLGSYNWGGAFYTSFVIDPKEDLIAIFMGQLNPNGKLNLNSKVLTLAYQAIKD